MRKRRWFGVLGLVVIVSGVLGAANYFGWFDRPVKCIFNGDSRNLHRTMIVPALDSPLTAGKNIIWCSSFQLAWNHAWKDVVHTPIKLRDAPFLADRLNRAPQSEADLPPGACYATAGMLKNGIIPTIQRKMAQRFPGHPLPTFTAKQPDDIIAYGYLEADARFYYPLDVLNSPLNFTDSAHQAVRLTSFGINRRTKAALKQQARIAFYSADGHEYIAGILCASRTDIILACIPPKATLAATVVDAEAKMAATKATVQASHISHFYSFNADETLSIPNMNWQVVHHFIELENQYLVNPSFLDYRIADAQELIKFSLDHTGARLRSEAQISITLSIASHVSTPPPPPRHLLFNRPFLLYMKQHKGKQPFFAMWVDNAELLDKW